MAESTTIEEMAEMATTKLELLRKKPSVAKPKPLDKKDTFAGQFDSSVRYPQLKQIAEAARGRR